jgi:predicted metal-dependent HD superfamily phosphohydrolase
MTEDRDALIHDWLHLLAGFGVPEAEARRGFQELALAYSEPGRFYHNLDHIRAVLDTINSLSDLTPHPETVRLAAWFHDAVHDSRSGDNEERSAALAEARCAAWGIAGPTVQTVVRLILATKTHQADPEDTDAQVLLDADLAILGSAEETYARYAAAIRREYLWVPEEEYRRGRVRVLRTFLQRERIFRLDRMHGQLDVLARRNLSREIEDLGGGPG